MNGAHDIEPFIFLPGAFVMSQKLVFIVGQIVGIQRKRPIFKFKKPRDAFFCALKAVLDVLLNYSPVYDPKLDRNTNCNNLDQ